MKELRTSLETINKTASGLITDIDRHLAEICKERGIDPQSKEQTQIPEQVKALEQSEKLYLVSDSTYLHIQRSDEGFDYTLYDKESMRLLDGGQLDNPDILLSTACMEICKLHDLDTYAVRLASLDMLEPLQEAQKVPVPIVGEDMENAADDGTATAPASMLPDSPEQAMEEPLPDPTITPQMMEYFGYTDSDMLPLSKDRAMELAEKDITVYMLYADNTEAMVFDTEDVVNHDGLFGISREDWEAIKADIPLRNVEQRFLDSPTDSMAIYQLRRDAPVELRFARMENLSAPPDPANYEAVYTREVYPDSDRSRTLENFYYIFNEERPVDFTGHSLSVSDIVALKQDGKVSYHYCDSVGFKELPAFQRPENYLKAAEMSMEDDYGMIDGIVNNGKAADQDCKEKKPSVLEQLRSQPIPERSHKTAPKKSAEREI